MMPRSYEMPSRVRTPWWTVWQCLFAGGKADLAPDGLTSEFDRSGSSSAELKT